MKEIVITENESNQRLDRFLKKLLPNAGKSLIQKMIRKKNILVNNLKCTPNLFIKLEDTIQIYLSDKTFEKFNRRKANIFVKQNLSIVYEDDDLLIVDKPSNLLTHGNDIEKKKTLINYAINYLIEIGFYNQNTEKTFRPACSIRLDRNTSGLVIICKNYHSLKTINKLIRERKINKYYKAIVYSEMRPKTGLISGFIVKDRFNNQSFVIDTEKDGSKKFEMKIDIKNNNAPFYLLNIQLLTGRSHQIRSYLNSEKIFILGDRKYGNAQLDNRLMREFSNSNISFNNNNQILKAYKLEFMSDSKDFEYLNKLKLEIDFNEKDKLIEKHLFGNSHKKYARRDSNPRPTA